MAKVTINQDRCKGCGLCVSVCPKKVLVLNKEKLNRKGYNPAEPVKPEACIGCAMCATMCPDCVIEITD